MNLSAPFVNRPVMTTLVMVAILFFGTFAYLTLPISDMPSFSSPVIQVSAQNMGSDAQTMASTVATPLEMQIMTVPGLTEVISTSTASNTLISCNFDLDYDITLASTDIAAALVWAQGNLPAEMPDPPTYRRYNPAQSPAIFLAISSTSMTMADLYDYANTAAAQRISMVQGVSKVALYGAPRAIRIKFDPDKLHALKLGIDQVAEQCKLATQILPGGTVYGNDNQITILPQGQLTSGEEYEEIIVAYRNNKPIRIKDIGRAVTGLQYDNFFINFWSQDQGEIPTMVLAVVSEPGYNTVKMCDDIVTLLPGIERTLPSSIKLNVIFNRAEGIRASIADVELTLIIAFILVAVVIFLFIGKIMATIIPVVALPMSIVGTFIAMKLLGYSVDILSMLGLTLVVGFLVDDAIVVLENNVRHVEMGKTPLQAALDGSKQISTTVLSMTLSLAAVFIPFIFMPGIIGKMFHEFAMVVVISVLISGFMSLTLTPMLCSKFIKGSDRQSRLEKIAHAVFHTLLNSYMPALKWTLRHRWVPLTLCIVSIVLAGVLFMVMPQDFLPPGDTGVIEGVTYAKQGVSPIKMKELELELSRIGRQNPAVGSIIAVANVPDLIAPNQGMIFFNLTPIKKRQPINKVVKELRESFKNVPGILPFLKPMPEVNLTVGTSTTRAAYAYYLSTMDNPEKMYEKALEFTEALKKLPELEGVSSDVQISSPQLTVDILRDEASSFGVSAKTIEWAFDLAYAGSQLTTFSTPINTYWIVTELDDEFKKDASSLDKLYLTSSTTDDVIPLRSVAKWDLATGPQSVNHVNQFTSATIYFNLAEGAALGTAVKNIEQIADKLLPTEIIRNFQGAAEVFKGTMGPLMALVVVGIFTIYLLLGILYESFIHPITILSALPGGLFGALFTLFIFHASLSLYAYVGIIVLIGIIMKNGIMLVEFANELVENGHSAFDAIVEASKIRFRPILMTTIAAAMGAVPIVAGLGADTSSRRPLGLALLGGLLFAQFITYFFTPMVYLTFEQVQEKATRH